VLSKRGRPPKSKRSSDEKKQSKSKGSSDEKQQSTVKSDEQKRREAAVSAFLSDLPHPLLKVLIRDAKVRSMTIKSEKKMRKKILQEIKEEARRTRQDPLQVLEAAVRMGGSSGTMRQYCILGSLLSGSTVGSTLPTAANVAKAKRELMELAVEDLQLSATPDGYRISLLRAVEMEALRLMQTIRSSKFAGGGMEARTVGLDPDDSLNWQDFFHVKLTFDARRITKNCSQTEVMIIFLPKGQGGVERCQKALHMRTIAVWSGKDSKENVVRNLTEIVKESLKHPKIRRPSAGWASYSGSLQICWHSARSSARAVRAIITARIATRTRRTGICRLSCSRSRKRRIFGSLPTTMI